MTMTPEEYQEYTQKLLEMQRNLAEFTRKLAEAEKMLLNLQHQNELAEIYQREADMQKQLFTPHDN